MYYVDPSKRRRISYPAGGERDSNGRGKSKALRVGNAAVKHPPAPAVLSGSERYWDDDAEPSSALERD